jgi:hypothetical protein
MNRLSLWVGRQQTPRVAALLLMVLVVGACRKEEIQVYRVPKQIPAAASSGSDSLAADTPAQPRVGWTLPGGWKEIPAAPMRLASFSATAQDGREAKVSIAPFPRGMASDAQYVNIWREKLHLPELTESNLVSESFAVTIGDGAGRLFDMLSTEPLIEEKRPARMLLAMLPRTNTVWFIQMFGDDDAVAGQKPAFVEFLRSLKFHNDTEPVQLTSARPGVSTNVKRVPRGRPERPLWTLPPQWQEQPASELIFAKFLIAATGEGKAEVSVAVFPGQAGGVLMNVNRWRGQIGLASIDQAALSRLTTALDPADPTAILIDMTGQDLKSGAPTRLIAAIVPKGEYTWFYKLMGGEPAVDREKAAFVKFVQTARYVSTP